MKKILFFASAVAVLFSSCSTDNTQDVIGNEAMGTISATAAYQQDATRTQLDKDGNVVWSKGDAIGVFGASGPQVQFGLVSGENTTGGKFSGNKNYLKVGEPAYAYYPYTKGTELTGTKVELEILAEQTYLPTDGYASFDAAMAPAFAYIEKLSDTDNVAFNFTGAAAYLEFPVVGYGTLESMTLTIGDGTLTPLAGVGSIDITVVDNPATEDVDETPYIELASTDATEITVYCGDVALKPYDPVMVSFVVPANIDLSKVNLTAKVSGVEIPAKSRTFTQTDGEYPKTKRNYRTKINFDSNKNPWSFGLEKKYVISGDNDQAALDFLAYAYLAQADNYLRPNTDYVYGTNGSTEEDWAALTEYFGENPYDYAAISFVEKIDLDAFDADAKFAELGTIVNPTSKDKFYRNVLTWYINNEYAIESLHDYHDTTGIIGALTTPTEITGLKVLGNGISTGAFLSNIKFANTTVIATQNDFAGFVAPKGDTANVEDVVLGKNNQLIATAAGSKYVGGIVGYYYASAATIDVDVEALPTIVTTLSLDETAIGQLYGIVIADKNMVISLADNNVTSLDAPVIYEATSKGVIDVTSEIAAPEGAKFAGIVAKNTGASIVVDNVSYWNGIAYETNGGDAYFTAEELAYILSDNAVTNIDIAMTHNIDMQNIEFTHSASGSLRANVINEEAYEIANVAAKYNGNGYIGLFGVKSNLENLELSNIVMNVTASHNTLGDTIGGLAIAGTATDVVVNGLTLNLPNSGTAVTTPKYIGGVFGTIDTDDIINVEVKSFKVNYAGEQTLNASAGVIAGKLNVTPTVKVPSVDLKTTTLSGAKTAYLFSGNYAGQQTRALNETDVYKVDNCYANKYLYTYGVINVTNPEFSASKSTAWLNVNADSKSWTERIAAGIVFNFDDWTDVDTTVGHDAAVDYGYKFVLNKEVNKSWNVWGFTPAE